jgi:hypothetical protein
MMITSEDVTLEMARILRELEEAVTRKLQAAHLGEAFEGLEQASPASPAS